jgi:hypothetical protein
MDKLEQMAINFMNKGKSVKRKTTSICSGKERTGKSKLMHLKMLETLKSGGEILVSTIDVEMFKWRFEQRTSEKVNLILTKHENVYKLELVWKEMN